MYTDAAACPCAPGGFFVGVWSSDGPVIHRCPQWVSSRQSAKLFRQPPPGLQRNNMCTYRAQARDRTGGQKSVKVVVDGAVMRLDEHRRRHTTDETVSRVKGTLDIP